MSTRDNALAWALNVASDPSTVFLDTETTGLEADAEICDIAIIAVDGTVLFDELVRPMRDIPAEATAVHGIWPVDVERAPFWSEIATAIREITRDRRVVVYNAAYDAGIINQCCSAVGIEPFAQDWQCAMKAYSEYDGTRSTHPRRPGFKWHKLDDAARHFGIQPGGHRALPDTETCRQVVLEMAALAQIEHPIVAVPASAFEQASLISTDNRALIAEAARR